MKWVLAFVAVLSAVVGGAYAGLPWILQTVIVGYASARGIVVSELQIQRPVWGMAVVDKITFSVGANDVQADSVAIGFTWDSFSNAKATRVTVAKLKVTARSDTSASAQGFAPGNSVEVGELITALPALLASTWDVVPADSFSVDEMRVGFADVDFSGAMELSRASASLHGRIDAPEPLPPLRIALQLEPGGNLLVEVREVGVSDNRLALEANLASASGTVEGSWTLTLTLDADAGSMAVSVEGSAPFALSHKGWVLESGLALAVQTHDWSAAFDLAGAEGLWRPEPRELARMLGSWRGLIRAETVTVSAGGGVSVSVGGARAQLTLDPGTVVTATGLAGEDWSIGAARMELTQGARLQVTLQPLGYRLQSSARMAVQLDQVVWSDYESSHVVDLTLQELRGDLDVVETAWQLEVPALQLMGTARATGRLPGGPFAFELSAEQRISQPLLANLVAGEPQTYDIDAGRLELHATLQVGGREPGKIAGRVSLTLADLSAHYEEIEVTGINAGVAIVFEDGAWQMGPHRVEVAFVDVGFPVTDLAADVTLTSERLLLSKLTGRTLAGSVTVASMEYDIARGSSEFVVEVEGVHLAEVLALEGGSVTGTGTLDGHLPLQITDDGVRVSDGRFSARPPGGVLSFAGAEEAAAALNQPGVGFAIAALGDFRFGVLDVVVNYEPNGDLQLGIHLEGHNPRFEAGRPIHYNLNISENIPMLLQSLQLSDEVSKRLQKRLTR